MTGIAIVAIPKSDSWVWDVSSEKVPHLTLLYLGEQDDADKVSRMIGLVKHSVETSLMPFWLPVSRRGSLGPKKADVAFLETEDADIFRFRSHLLRDTNIFKMYSSTPQFDGWTPHLTLGFPDTPAKLPLNAGLDQPVIEFDSIAVWTGDYEGPTFQLTGDHMSTDLDDVLAHYGIKGMKWGVRRGEGPLGGVKKRYEELSSRELLKPQTFTTSKGEKVTLVEEPDAKLAMRLASVIPPMHKKLMESKGFLISVNGTEIGDASFHRRSKDELNLVWLGVNEDQRGKGYASTVFDAGLEYAKSTGVKKLTLEVPGKAPDARHIYEKRGFRDTGVVSGDKNDIWGGLYHMEYDLKKERG